MKKKGIFAASFIGVASVWLGGHFGPGFATGAFSAQYYERYGWIGLVMPLLAMLITGGVMFYMVEYARSKGTTNYRSFVQSAFGSDTFGKVMVIFYDILFIGTVIGAGGLAVAGEANILGKVYGLGFWTAAIPTIIVAALLCLYGSKLVARSSKYMMYAIVVIVLLIFVLSCASGKPDYSAAFAAPPLEQNNTLLNAIWKAILYGCFQSTIAFNVMSVSDLLESRRHREPGQDPRSHDGGDHGSGQALADHHLRDPHDLRRADQRRRHRKRGLCPLQQALLRHQERPAPPRHHHRDPAGHRRLRRLARHGEADQDRHHLHRLRRHRRPGHPGLHHRPLQAEKGRVIPRVPEPRKKPVTISSARRTIRSPGAVLFVLVYITIIISSAGVCEAGRPLKEQGSAFQESALCFQ